jgi:hypothetical protein
MIDLFLFFFIFLTFKSLLLIAISITKNRLVVNNKLTFEKFQYYGRGINCCEELIDIIKHQCQER